MFGATVLVSGISGAAIRIGAVQLKGMALGTLVAFTLSLLFALFDLLGRGENGATSA